jgi:hypothetical protein
MGVLAHFRDYYEVNDNLEELDSTANAGRLASSDEVLHLVFLYHVKNWGFQNKDIKEADL